MTPSTALREHVRTHAENRPGVYRMFDAEGGLLYVGKSIRVRTRLLSYFRAGPGEKAQRLMHETARIEWDYIPNEFAALVTEMKAIQRWRPRFNVQHKRKRIYAFVKLTLEERAPRVVPVTRVVPDGSLYFGPFPRVGDVGRTVRELVHVVGLRDCPATTPVAFDDQMEFFEGGRTPLCLRAELGTCLAPCCGSTSAAAYAERVREARAFLEGRGRGPLERVERAMRAAAARRDFEYAAQLRDRLERLASFQQQLAAFRGRVASLSFVYRVPGFAGDDRIYVIRRGRIRDDLPHPRSAAARRRACARIERVLGEPDAGPAGLRPEEAAETLLVARWFRLRPRELKRTTPIETWMAEAAGTAGSTPGATVR
ncbi:MAG: nuclease [Gemmatimonadetes bacterium]|nr:MAG: nuclease [Gemmatimonadota bacterium]